MCAYCRDGGGGMLWYVVEGRAEGHIYVYICLHLDIIVIDEFL